MPAIALHLLTLMVLQTPLPADCLLEVATREPGDHPDENEQIVMDRHAELFEDTTAFHDGTWAIVYTILEDHLNQDMRRSPVNFVRNTEMAAWHLVQAEGYNATEPGARRAAYVWGPGFDGIVGCTVQ